MAHGVEGHDGGWMELLKPAATALVGAGGIGAFLTLLGRLFPSGDRRLDDRRDARREHLDRIHELEADLEAMTVKRNEEVERRIQTMQRMVMVEAQLALLRKNLGMQEGDAMKAFEAAPNMIEEIDAGPEPKRERLPEAGPEGEEL